MPSSPSTSAFQLSFRVPTTAATSNTNIKLKNLLTKPELAEAVRAELVPNGMTLLDLYSNVAWFPPATWKALGYGGVSKYHTLFTWLRLLAPNSCLPKVADVTENEIKAWGLRMERKGEQFKKDSAHAKTRRKDLGGGPSSGLAG